MADKQSTGIGHQRVPVADASAGGGSGDVTGPATNDDNAIARFDGVNSKTIQNSDVTIDDDGRVQLADPSGVGPLSFTARATAPSSPSAGDVYFDDGSNTTNGQPGMRYYTGAAWQDLSGDVYSTAAVADNTVCTFNGTTGAIIQGVPFTALSDSTVDIEFTAKSTRGLRLKTTTNGDLIFAPGGTGDVDANSNLVKGIDYLELNERTTPGGTAGTGRIWVKSDTPSTLYFTDDGGTDHQLGAGGSGGDVVGPASAADNRIATFDLTTGKLIQDGGATLVSNVLTMGDITISDLGASTLFSSGDPCTIQANGTGASLTLKTVTDNQDIVMDTHGTGGVDFSDNVVKNINGLADGELVKESSGSLTTAGYTPAQLSRTNHVCEIHNAANLERVIVATGSSARTINKVWAVVVTGSGNFDFNLVVRDYNAGTAGTNVFTTDKTSVTDATYSGADFNGTSSIPADDKLVLEITGTSGTLTLVEIHVETELS